MTEKYKFCSLAKQNNEKFLMRFQTKCNWQKAVLEKLLIFYKYKNYNWSELSMVCEFFFPQVCTVGFCGNDAAPICACNVWPIYFILKVQWLTRCMFNFKHAYNPAALISNLNSFEFFNKTL